MYVCTVSLPALNWLIRVDVEVNEDGSPWASYVRIDAYGAPDDYVCPISDPYGIGLPTVAIVDLIRDLNWSEVRGHVEVVHQGAVNQKDLEGILASVRPAYAIGNLATTGTVH